MDIVEGTTLAREVYDGIKLDFRHLVIQEFREIGNEKLKKPEPEIEIKRVDQTDYNEVSKEDRMNAFSIVKKILAGSYQANPQDHYLKALLQRHIFTIQEVRTLSSDVLVRIGISRMSDGNIYVIAIERSGQVYLWRIEEKTWDLASQVTFTDEEIEMLIGMTKKSVLGLKLLER